MVSRYGLSRFDTALFAILRGGGRYTPRWGDASLRPGSGMAKHDDRSAVGSEARMGGLRDNVRPEWSWAGAWAFGALTWVLGSSVAGAQPSLESQDLTWVLVEDGPRARRVLAPERNRNRICDVLSEMVLQSPTSAVAEKLRLGKPPEPDRHPRAAVSFYGRRYSRTADDFQSINEHLSPPVEIDERHGFLSACARLLARSRTAATSRLLDPNVTLWRAIVDLSTVRFEVLGRPRMTQLILVSRNDAGVKRQLVVNDPRSTLDTLTQRDRRRKREQRRLAAFRARIGELSEFLRFVPKRVYCGVFSGPFVRLMEPTQQQVDDVCQDGGKSRRGLIIKEYVLAPVNRPLISIESGGWRANTLSDWRIDVSVGVGYPNNSFGASVAAYRLRSGDSDWQLIKASDAAGVVHLHSPTSGKDALDLLVLSSFTGPTHPSTEWLKNYLYVSTERALSLPPKKVPPLLGVIPIEGPVRKVLEQLGIYELTLIRVVLLVIALGLCGLVGVFFVRWFVFPPRTRLSDIRFRVEG